MAKNKQNPKTELPKAKEPVLNRPAPKNSEPAKKMPAERMYLIVLIAIAMLVNIRTVTYEYTYDDAAFASENTLLGIKGMAAIPALMTHGKNYNYDKSNVGSYRPLLPVSFAIEHDIFGLNPGVSHFLNLLMFAVLIILLFKLLRKMFPTYPVYIPFAILLLFELHPIHTEVIASVKSRDELLAFIFTLMGMMQSFKYIDNNKVRPLILSAVYFLIALLCKESPVPFVGIVPLTLYFFTKANMKQLAIATVPYFAMLVVFVIMRASILDQMPNNNKVAITENAMVGITNFSEKMGTALWIQLKYIILMIFPHPLSFDYSYNQIPFIGMTDYKAIISLVIMIALLAYAFINLRKKDIFSFSILFYYLAMSITSNMIIEIGATMGERFTFIGSLGFCIAVVLLLAKAMKVDLSNVSFNKPPAFTYVLIAIAVLYSGKTMSRNEDWKTNFDLYKSGAEVTPNSWRAQKACAIEYREKGNKETDPVAKRKYYDEAIKHFSESIRVYPYKAETHADLGAAYFTIQNQDSAKVHLERAIQLNPKEATASANLGTVYMTQGKYVEGLYYYRMAIAAKPDNVIAMFNLGVCYAQVLKYDSALIAFKKSLQIAPEYNGYKAFEYTAIMYKTLGRFDSAAKYEALGKQFTSMRR